MAERLSQLQKWILVEIYRDFKIGWYGEDPLKRSLRKRYIYSDYYGVRNLHGPKMDGVHAEHYPYERYDNPKASIRAKRAKPAVLVSMKGLVEKGLIKVKRPKQNQREEMDDLYLTVKGIEKAKGLLGKKANLKRIKNPFIPKERLAEEAKLQRLAGIRKKLKLRTTDFSIVIDDL